jgi:hypothetical protein
MTSEYEELRQLAKTDQQAKKVLAALEKTLDFYQIKTERSLMANAILYFSKTKGTMVPVDEETKTLCKMSDTFLENCK